MCSSSGIAPRPALRRSWFFVVRAVKPIGSSPRSESGGFPSSLAKVLHRAIAHVAIAVEPRGLEPRTSAVQGRRSPS
jgi:hypothetical protein